MKPAHLRIRPRLGDLVEVPTAKGLAYLHHTHYCETYGHFIRAIEGLHSQRPDDLEVLIHQPTLFWRFFRLGLACWQRLVKIVASFPVPEEFRPVPPMRTTSGHDAYGYPRAWALLHNGRRIDLGEDLTEEEQRLSWLLITSWEGLLYDLEEQMRPEKEYQLLQRRRAARARGEDLEQ